MPRRPSGVAICALVVAVSPACRRSEPPPGAHGSAAHAQQPAVPVVAVEALRSEQPRFLEGLGTVVPRSTTTVRTRVDGPIVKIAFREGQVVKAGDLLAVIDKRPFAAALAQAKAQLAKDEAMLASAKADLAHFEAAAEALPVQQIEHGRAAVEAAQAQIGVDKAQIETAALNLEFTDIRAPISGVIGLRQVDVGNLVHATDTNGIAVITQVQPIDIVFTLPQEQLPAMREAEQRGPVAVDIYDRNLSRKLTDATLIAIDNQIDTTTGTARFKAAAKNDDNKLFPNQFVNARLLASVATDVVLVPTAAIQPGPDGKQVYVVRPDNTIDVRRVEVGTATGDMTSIEKGVEAGERVVTSGVDKLAPGTPVVVTPPRGAPPREPPP
ncbi:MAG: efflux RND transporter periplasmic adaptor subunit [Kofleriaceae bacterium]|nr:efflux RND transporter periplasmic adaptor subunit [Kofleriaceae bacterium]